MTTSHFGAGQYENQRSGGFTEEYQRTEKAKTAFNRVQSAEAKTSEDHLGKKSTFFEGKEPRN